MLPAACVRVYTFGCSTTHYTPAHIPIHSLCAFRLDSALAKQLNRKLEQLKRTQDKLTLPLFCNRDLAKQYEKKLEQLKREEELIREEGQEAEELPEGHSLPARDSAPELAAAAAATAVMREAAATAVMETLQVLRCVYTV